MDPFPAAESANPKKTRLQSKNHCSREGREEKPGGASHPSTAREPILTIGSVSVHPLPNSISKS